MNKNIAAFAIILCIASASPAFARGNNHGSYGGGHHRQPYYSHSRSHHNDGLGIAFGVMGGLLLGSALLYSAAPPPPPTVVYNAPYPTYAPEVVVQQPRICVEERMSSGQWQINQYDGRRVWVQFASPVIQRVEVECY